MLDAEEEMAYAFGAALQFWLCVTFDDGAVFLCGAGDLFRILFEVIIRRLYLEQNNLR